MVGQFGDRLVERSQQTVDLVPIASLDQHQRRAVPLEIQSLERGKLEPLHVERQEIDGAESVFVEQGTERGRGHVDLAGLDALQPFADSNVLQFLFRRPHPALHDGHEIAISHRQRCGLEIERYERRAFNDGVGTIAPARLGQLRNRLHEQPTPPSVPFQDEGVALIDAVVRAGFDEDARSFAQVGRELSVETVKPGRA